MDRDRVILGALSEGAIEVDGETGSIYSRRIRGKVGQRVHLSGSVCNGYIVHSLSYKGTKKQARAHRIVWMAAYGPIPPDLVVDHINRQRTDNRLANLRLVDTKGNAANRPDLTGEQNHAAKHTVSQVREIRLLHQQGHTIYRIAERYDVSKSQVYNIISGASWIDEDIRPDTRAWLEHPRWPAGPGQSQQAWEPPRTIPKGVDPYRRKRLHALGNSVMPAQVWPLFHAIAEIEASEQQPSLHPRNNHHCTHAKKGVRLCLA